MLIECLGPSGIGKSTILSNLYSLWRNVITFPVDLPSNISVNKMHHFSEENHWLQGKDDYINCCLDILSHSKMTVHQKHVAVKGIFNSFLAYGKIRSMQGGGSYPHIVHDELCLHRADSILHFSPSYEKDAERYFSVVPLPDGAVFLLSQEEDIMQHLKARNVPRNCYASLDEKEVRNAISRLLKIDRIGYEILRGRGVTVKLIDLSTNLPIDTSCNMFSDALYDILAEKRVELNSKDAYMISTYDETISELKSKMADVCRRFKKKNSRHVLRHAGLIYCAFTLPGFTVFPYEAQRDAQKRFRKFGLNESIISGKSLLDLGSNTGAMLFQATNYGLANGIGIEFDKDKVAISEEIAKKCHIKNISFIQGDIDIFNFKNMEKFDIVFALSIESHLLYPERLCAILGLVTKGMLFFEGNGNCNIREVGESLEKEGFGNIRYLGFCDDDVDSRNNNRPLLIAEKIMDKISIIKEKMTFLKQRNQELLYAQNELKERIKRLQKKQVTFVSNLATLTDDFRMVDYMTNITLEACNSSYRYFAYKSLTVRTFYSVELECEGNFTEYTVRVYDTELKCAYVQEIYSTRERMICNFITHEDVQGVHFLVYAGIAGNTNGKNMLIKEMTVKSCPLDEFLAF